MIKLKYISFFNILKLVYMYKAIEYPTFIYVGAIIPLLAAAYVWYSKEEIANAIINKIKS